ncbi:uncharacterized protein LOC116957407 [Petromyzon marinus]|uniref:Uncharacterized protein LOC116957407 n=1 Tax=Petromyzon marinus TaxID=7757 RepID=A0AAJ7UFN2_PETMA|nr:uncharacterized protein LOC116957407 [Petromyzon marinus]
MAAQRYTANNANANNAIATVYTSTSRSGGNTTTTTNDTAIKSKQTVSMAWLPSLGTVAITTTTTTTTTTDASASTNILKLNGTVECLPTDTCDQGVSSMALGLTGGIILLLAGVAGLGRLLHHCVKTRCLLASSSGSSSDSFDLPPSSASCTPLGPAWDTVERATLGHLGPNVGVVASPSATGMSPGGSFEGGLLGISQLILSQRVLGQNATGTPRGSFAGGRHGMSQLTPSPGVLEQGINRTPRASLAGDLPGMSLLAPTMGVLGPVQSGPAGHITPRGSLSAQGRGSIDGGVIPMQTMRL